MNNVSIKSERLAQSASTIGAALLGIGLGIKWGHSLKSFAVAIIIIGALIHVYGMYVVQMRKRENSIDSKILWVTAWICLVALAVLFIFL